MDELPHLPASRQPDAEPDRAPPPHPSLIVYFALLAIAALLIAIADSIDPGPLDLPGLLINLGASLVSAVVLLVFIDRRLRQSEIKALMSMPARAGLFIALTVSPRRKQLYRFNLRQLDRLGNLTGNKVISRAFGQVTGQSGSFNLLGAPGSGKTTVLQMLCARRARDHAEDFGRPVPILYPVARWLPDRTLDEAILEHMNGFYPVTKRAFRATLRKKPALIILDGADEIFSRDPNRLGPELSRLRSAHPKLTWIVSSRPTYPNPMTDLPAVSLAEPTKDEIEEILRRHSS